MLLVLGQFKGVGGCEKLTEREGSAHRCRRRGGDAGEGDAGVRFHLPRGPDLAGPDGRALAAAAAAAGLEALPHMAEIYPLGGKQPAAAPGAWSPEAVLIMTFASL